MKKQAFLKHVLFLAVVLLLSAGPATTMTALAEAAGGDQLTTTEAAAVLKNFDPGIQVKSVDASPVDGLWEIIVTVKGEVGIVYIAADKKHVILGSIVDTANKANLTKARFEAVKDKYEPKIDFASISLDDAVILGDPKAKHKVVVFDDPS